MVENSLTNTQQPTQITDYLLLYALDDSFAKVNAENKEMSTLWCSTRPHNFQKYSSFESRLGIYKAGYESGCENDQIACIKLCWTPLCLSMECYLCKCVMYVPHENGSYDLDKVSWNFVIIPQLAKWKLSNLCPVGELHNSIIFVLQLGYILICQFQYSQRPITLHKNVK